MTLRLIFPNSMFRAAPVVSKVAVALLGIIVIAALVSNWSLFLANANASVLGGALVCLMVTLLAVGFIVPLILGLPLSDAKTFLLKPAYRTQH